MKIVTEEQIQKQTDEYIANHSQEIHDLIDKKIATAVRAAITDAFNGYAGSVNSQIRNMVQGRIDEITESLNIDEDALRIRLQKRIDQQIKKANIEISL